VLRSSLTTIVRLTGYHSQELLEKHYEDLASKGFFPRLIQYSKFSYTCGSPLILGIDSAVRPRRLHGLGRSRCRQDRPRDAWRDQPARFQPW
jgi:hypothetical protein